jgi:geranyl diphosphate 2-C-methyltransferase
MGLKRTEFLKEVARYYDSKKKDLNLLLAKDKIVHHHSGICSPNSVFPKMTEEKLLIELHRQENELTRRGMQYLGKIKPNMRGFDAGCGRGGSSFMIHQKFGCFIDGVTLSAYQAKFASRLAKELGVANHVRFYQGNMLETPFEEKIFDFVWACESTEHIPDLDEMFREFSRIIKHKGRLVIIAGCGIPKNPEGPKYIKRINDWFHIRIHSPEEYIQRISQYGWKLLNNVDLTSNTIPYWKLRSRSTHKTGVEFLKDAYAVGALEYRLFAYQKKN